MLTAVIRKFVNLVDQSANEGRRSSLFVDELGRLHVTPSQVAVPDGLALDVSVQQSNVILGSIQAQYVPPLFGVQTTSSSTPVAFATDAVLPASLNVAKETGGFLFGVYDRLPTALGAGGGMKIDGSGTPLPISASALPLPSGAATAAGQPLGAAADTGSRPVIQSAATGSATGAWSKGCNTGFGTAAIQLASSGGRIRWMLLGNETAAKVYFMLFDTVTQPVNGAFVSNPIYTKFAAASTGIADQVFPDGLFFSNGLWLVASTTGGSITLSATSLCIATWMYK